MTITLNNRIETFNFKVMTISELLKHKNFTFRLLVIKVNGKLIKKHKYDNTEIYNGDKIDIIHMISGG